MLLGVELRRPALARAVVEGGGEAFLNAPLPDAVHRGHADLEGSCDVAVRQPVIGLQEDPRPR